MPQSPEKRHAMKVVRQLAKDYADAECALNFRTPYQLLIATILSAQCTDERVNIVTKSLFNEFPNAKRMAAATQKQIEKHIKSAGFFRAKAKNIKSCSEDLVNLHGSKVPQDFDALVKLAGVGRKTANVVMGVAWGIPTGVVVDTHVGRISRRLGITSETDPVKAERELISVIPQAEWIDYSHRMIHHGRAVCNARKPNCENCRMKRFCPRIGVTA
tara:strand:- start:1154 stop:1801 length:648 start_codon:yes stop_codon:yes gene_type:complete